MENENWKMENETAPQGRHNIGGGVNPRVGREPP